MQKKLVISKIEKMMGSASGIALGGLLIWMFCPTVIEESAALNEPAWTTHPASIAVATEQEAEVDITPAANGTTGVMSAHLAVKTEQAKGYNLYINAVGHCLYFWRG